MRKIALLALASFVIGCSSVPSPTPTPETGASIPGAQGLTLASAIQSKNVTLYPVVSTKPNLKQMDDMITLSEARARGWVKVEEQPDETVEVLQVTNTGTKSIFLLAGDILLGGKQDRIISEDTVVPPGKTVKVKVFCVDQGRWSGDDKFMDTGMQATSRVKEAAMVARDQGRVWEEVENSNTLAAKADTELHYLAGASLRQTVDSKLIKARQADVDGVVAQVMKVPNVVGVVTVVDGKLSGFEYFGSNTFFGKALPNILKGVFTDALINKGEMAKSVAGSKEAAAFVADSLQGKQESRHVGFSGQELQVTRGRSAQGAVSAPAQAAGGAVYRGAYFKK